MLAFNFLGVTSLVFANVALATPTLRDSMDHWGGFGSLVKIAMSKGTHEVESWSTKGAHLASSAAPGTSMILLSEA